MEYLISLINAPVNNELIGFFFSTSMCLVILVDDSPMFTYEDLEFFTLPIGGLIKVFFDTQPMWPRRTAPSRSLISGRTFGAVNAVA